MEDRLWLGQHDNKREHCCAPAAAAQLPQQPLHPLSSAEWRYCCTQNTE